MSIKIVHDAKCNEFTPNKEVCSCAHDAVLSLTNATNILAEKTVELLHALENSKPNADIPVLAGAIRDRLYNQVLDDVNLVTRKMLTNWRQQQ